MNGTTTLYRFFDSDGQLLYVGITGRGDQRWAEHAKTKPWWTEVATTTTVHYQTRAEALNAEIEAIELEHPLHNIIHSKNPPRSADDAVELICHVCKTAITGKTGGLGVDVVEVNRVEAAQKAAHIKEGGWIHLDIGIVLDNPDVPWLAYHYACDPDPDGPSYWIDADRITSLADVLQWTAHLMGKNWIDYTTWSTLISRINVVDAEPIRRTHP